MKVTAFYLTMCKRKAKIYQSLQTNAAVRNEGC